MANIVSGMYEWDSEKESINFSKHGFRFSEILPMFDDPLLWERYDIEHSTENENRYIGTAKVCGATLVVSYTNRKNRTRIISARISSPQEEKQYEEWCKQFYT